MKRYGMGDSPGNLHTTGAGGYATTPTSSGGNVGQAQADAAYQAQEQALIQGGSVAAQDATAAVQAATASMTAADAALQQASQSLAKITAANQGSVSPAVANYLGVKNQHLTPVLISNYAMPSTQTSMAAGMKAGLKQLELQFAAGQITQAQFNQAVAAFNVPQS